MTPSKPKRSVLPALLLALAGVTWVYFYTTGAKEDPWEPFRSEESASELEAAGDLEVHGGSASPENAVERTALKSAQAGANEVAQQKQEEEQPVRVRAEIRLDQEKAGSAPKNVEGWVVVVQTWDAALATTPRYEGVADQHGVAELEFPGDVHIDWVSCLPPADSGFGFSFIEEHEDLVAGEDYLAVLTMELKRTAVGTVVDQNERPVMGAIVHAYDENWTYGLSDWTPGFLQTTTDAQGRFEFSQLTNGEWVFAVEPSSWLMVEPAHGDQEDFHGTVYFDEGSVDPGDAGVLQCIPLSTVKVSVLDLDGQPLPGAKLFVEPITFDASYLIPTQHDLDLRNPDVEFDEEGLINVGDYREFFTADDAGNATLRLVPGRWMMWANPLPGMDPDQMKTPEKHFHTQEGVLNYQLPVHLMTVTGIVSGSDGSHPHAEVRFSWKGPEFQAQEEVITDNHGRFVFHGVLVDGGYEVRAWPESPNWLPEQWDFTMRELQAPLDLILEPGASLSLRFENMKEAPNSADFGVLRLESWIPPGNAPVDRNAYWWEIKQRRAKNVLPNRNVRISGLAPGSYEISLSLPTPNYQAKASTKPDMYERQRWTLKTQDATQVLVIGE